MRFGVGAAIRIYLPIKWEQVIILTPQKTKKAFDETIVFHNENFNQALMVVQGTIRLVLLRGEEK